MTLIRPIKLTYIKNYNKPHAFNQESLFFEEIFFCVLFFGESTIVHTKVNKQWSKMVLPHHKLFLLWLLILFCLVLFFRIFSLVLKRDSVLIAVFSICTNDVYQKEPFDMFANSAHTFYLSRLFIISCHPMCRWSGPRIIHRCF